MSNLRLINETTVQSGVASVNITDVFSADYDIYKIVVPNMLTVGDASTDVAYRFINSSGSVISSSKYDWASLNITAYNPFVENKATNESYIRKLGQADNDPEGDSITSYIFNPFSSSSYTFTLWQSSYSFGSGKGGTKGIGVLEQTSSISGFQLYAVSQTRVFDTGLVRTYGLRVDS